MKHKRTDDGDSKGHLKMISALTDRAIGEVWAYVRTNKHNLNSDVARKHIRRAIDVATDDANQIISKAVEDARLARANEIKWRREMRSMRMSLRSAQRNNQRLLRETQRLTETIQIQQEVILSNGVDKNGYEDSD